MTLLTTKLGYVNSDKIVMFSIRSNMNDHGELVYELVATVEGIGPVVVERADEDDYSRLYDLEKVLVWKNLNTSTM